MPGVNVLVVGSNMDASSTGSGRGPYDRLGAFMDGLNSVSAHAVEVGGAEAGFDGVDAQVGQALGVLDGEHVHRGLR
jgi:hypothetical protein